MQLNSTSDFFCKVGCSNAFLLHFSTKLRTTCCTPIPFCFELQYKTVQGSCPVVRCSSPQVFAVHELFGHSILRKNYVK